jgi:hypothetical protein
MKIYQHKQTKVFMSENDYNHLSSDEQNEMELCTFNPNKTSRTENGLVDMIIGVNGRIRQFKSVTYGGNK